MKKRWPFLLIGIAAILNIAVQARQGSVLIGSDAIFHFNRFYDAAQQLKDGNFNLFATNYGFAQSGRIVNGVYGPVFAYLNGALLLILNSWFVYELVTSFIVYSLGASGMYCLSRKLGANHFSSVAVAICYMTAGWLPRWQIAQNMTAWGAAIMPFALLTGIRMIQDRKDPIKVVPLAISASILMQIHLLSALILFLALSVFFLFGISRAENPKWMFSKAVEASGLTILLSANVLGNLLEVFGCNNISSPISFKTWKHALKFTLLGSGRGQINIILFVLFILSIYWAKRKKDTLTIKIGIISLLFMILASNIFPWEFSQSIIPQLGHNFQMPSRLMIVAYPLLYSVLAKTFSELPIGINLIRTNRQVNHQRIYLTNTNHLVIMNHNANKIIRSYRSKNLNDLLQIFAKRSPDYLPVYDSNESSISKIYENTILKNKFKGGRAVDDDGNLILYWNNDYPETVQLPIITYAQTSLVLNGHTIKPKINKIGVPMVSVPPGYHEVEVHFNASPMIPLLWMISMLTWILIGLGKVRNVYDPKLKLRPILLKKTELG